MFLCDLKEGICTELGLSDETFVREICKDIYRIVGTHDIIIMGENPTIKKGLIYSKDQFVKECNKTSKRFNIPLNICMIIKNNQIIAEFLSDIKCGKDMSVKDILGNGICKAIGLDSFNQEEISALSDYLTT